MALVATPENFELAFTEWAAVTGIDLDHWDGLSACPHPRSLYFARAPGRAIKIGISDDPHKRIASLNSPNSAAARVRWLGALGEHRLIVAATGFWYLDESRIHDFLAAERIHQGGRSSRSEWYRGPSVELLLALVCLRAEPERKASAS